MLGCCGAPAYWSGRADLFQASLENLREQWQRLGSPRVITACATCQSIFKEELPGMEAVSLWSVLEESGLPGGPAACAAAGTTVSVADPCMSRHQPEIRESVRRIVRSLGIGIDELALSGEKPECCGYGGLMFNANPKLADEVISHRAGTANPDAPAAKAKPFTQPGGWQRAGSNAAADTVYYRSDVKGHDYLAYCAMCRDRMAAQGKRASHLLELVFPSVEGGDPAARGWISWSERRTNRARVKEGILRERGEEGWAMTEEPSVKLQMSDEVRRQIDGRRILEEDVQSVIAQAELTGRRLKDERTGRYLAYHRPENVTFWVDYAPGDDGFIVHNAYCHRMNIVGVKR